MNNNIPLLVFCVICDLLVISVYYSKDRLNLFENKIYSALLFANIIGCFLEIICILSALKFIPQYDIFVRLFLNYILIWGLILSFYTIAVCIRLKNELFAFIFFLLLIVILSVPIYILPIELMITGSAAFAVGIVVNYLGLVLSIDTLIVIICVFKNRKKVEDKKIIPVFIYITIMVILMLVQQADPSIQFFTSVEGFVGLMMYFTIENPDVKMLEKVEIARDAAEKANRAKSDFLSSMSHEIRTPLNAIVGLSEDIGTYKDQVPEAVSEDAEDIINASQTLLEIVGNILDINKIESNKLEIVELVYNPRETIENVAKLDATRIGEKPIDFKVNIAPDIPYELIGDKVHIKEIVNNLLTNAIKYTEQGEINLNVRCINKGDLSNLIISVQDTGRGIKAENITKLFKKFERLDVERNTTTEGTGLGLAITKRLVEMMNGTINVQSQFGKGSIFVVNIPQKIKTLTSTLTNKEEDEEAIIDIDNYGDKKILIVDDNTLNIKVARRALQDFNFDIEDVLSGQECLDKVSSGNKYDLILMDIMMPNMSGETTFKKLKEIDGFKTPVIALTADAVAGAEEHYKGEGFVDYIAKPFKREQIKEKLDIIFDSKAPINWDEVPVHVIGEETSI